MADYHVSSPDFPKVEMAESEENDGPGGLGLSEGEQRLAQEGDMHYRGVMSTQLHRLTVMCLIFNRMIGMYSSYSLAISQVKKSLKVQKDDLVIQVLASSAHLPLSSTTPKALA
jgi:hypothetical protein